MPSIAITFNDKERSPITTADERQILAGIATHRLQLPTKGRSLPESQHTDQTACPFCAIDALSMNSLRRRRDDISACDSTVEAFNIGINVGTVAGQMISALLCSPDRVSAMMFRSWGRRASHPTRESTLSGRGAPQDGRHQGIQPVRLN
jgi:hypothetical protein